MTDKTTTIKRIIIYKKHLKYKKERLEILHKIYDIIGINEQNKMFFVSNIDTKKQTQIMELMPTIQTYFKTSVWVTAKKDYIVEKPYLSIIRCVLRDMNIKYLCSSCRIKDEKEKSIYTTMYTLNDL